MPPVVVHQFTRLGRDGLHWLAPDSVCELEFADYHPAYMAALDSLADLARQVNELSGPTWDAAEVWCIQPHGQTIQITLLVQPPVGSLAESPLVAVTPPIKISRLSPATARMIDDCLAEAERAIAMERCRA
jgi:hypothetical protein